MCLHVQLVECCATIVHYHVCANKLGVLKYCSWSCKHECYFSAKNGMKHRIIKYSYVCDIATLTYGSECD